MSINPTPNKIRNTAAIFFVLGFVTFVFAQEPGSESSSNKSNASSQAKKVVKEELNLTTLQKEARMYRTQGLEMQKAGDLDAAMSFYQKAAVLDNSYAVVFNDLGIIYEAKGLTDKAEESYKRCLTIDPNFLSAYTNLALLYENSRDIQKAGGCWERRAKLGSPDDPWTQKALARYNDIRLVLSDKPFDEAKEQEIVGLMKDVSNQKAFLKKDNKALAKSYLKKAKLCYKKGDDVTALKIAIDASQLDPSNKEIKEFVEKVQTRVLSK